MKQITIQQLKEKLNYIDLRPIRKWCKRNDVEIIKQGRQEFVVESNFEEAYERPFINKLKNKFGKDWESVYRLYKNGNVPALNTLQSEPSVSYKAYKTSNKVYNTYYEKFSSSAKGLAA